MKIAIIAVGRVKERGLRDAIDDYEKRIKRYAKLDEIELEDGSTSEVEARFRKAIPQRARVIALEVEGQRMTSEKFARYVEQCEIGAVPALAFVIGGSYGLPKSVSDAADLKLSLSDMILPHRLARLFLAEQIYRAYTILRNEPYSH
ncbi:23S rRNA (pseudouridine(1915)-N(3))-methyltransferase RlmH [Sandaracinus amylolyticus]|uniref:23S rRNA (pseudouridine(1915)-N(3))-methyltransferase RlmH n=1 Tax=Sandaracinus amylolyticus TaxID=927083 RepID=UPI001F1EF950|nr:23S rRNA (pseudouridine(1915)-N(3))-methyltransferase RlmH [Sandaracinus amylolyticus]UJR80728.1 Ribosomal RNA large subunit methyltransferase H [Sandaracinus amylolyticus]